VDLVIADWIMPGESGLDLCAWVRRDSPRTAVHFVMVTVLSEREKLVEAFRCGVDDFLSKPYHEAELSARLRAWGRLISLQKQLALQHAEALRVNNELSAVNQRLAALATTDELTGLPNRRESVRRLEEQWAVASRYNIPICCAVVDLDLFKDVNDTYGHQVGDALLAQFAVRLRTTMRAADAAFRIGGDEFLVLLPGVVLSEADAWALRCQEAMAAAPFVAAGVKLYQSVSVGAAERSPTMHDWRELVAVADDALLAQKRERRLRQSLVTHN
jgi:diguanylate cyclase (GGDEF)-like protein